MNREQWEAERRGAWWAAYCADLAYLGSPAHAEQEADILILEWEKRFPAPEAADKSKIWASLCAGSAEITRAEAFERAAKICISICDRWDKDGRHVEGNVAQECAAEIRKEAGVKPPLVSDKERETLAYAQRVSEDAEESLAKATYKIAESVGARFSCCAETRRKTLEEAIAACEYSEADRARLRAMLDEAKVMK